MAPRCICRKVGKLFPGEPVELGHVPQRDAPAGELDDAGVLPMLEHPGDHLAGRGDAVGDALVGGDHGRRALLGILEQKMHRKTLREILEQEILHVEKNGIEQSEDRAKDGVLNAQIGVQHGLEIGERHDDGANVHLRFQLIVVENLRRWVAADVNDVLATADGDGYLMRGRGNQGDPRTPRKKSNHSDARASEVGNFLSRIPVLDGGMGAERVRDGRRNVLPEGKHSK